MIFVTNIIWFNQRFNNIFISTTGERHTGLLQNKDGGAHAKWHEFVSLVENSEK